MAKVEQSARTEDETYSASKEQGDSQAQGRAPESEARDSEFQYGEQPVDGDTSLMESSFGAEPTVEFPMEPSAKVSFFA